MSQTLREGFDISFTPIYWTYGGFQSNEHKMIDKQKEQREEVETQITKKIKQMEIYGEQRTI